MTSDPRDYKLDIRSLDPSGSEPTGRDPSGPRNASPRDPTPYLSVQFKCCSVYQRIYRNKDGSAYEGRCPRCAKPVRFIVGQGGTNERFFVVE